MAICIDGNFVCLTGGCFCATADGVEFVGDSKSTLFCELPNFQVKNVAGYISGGKNSCLNALEKFPFSSSSAGSLIGDLNPAFSPFGLKDHFGWASDTAGVLGGGYQFACPAPTGCQETSCFPFASDTPIALLSPSGHFGTFCRQLGTWQSSTHGYHGGGISSPSVCNCNYNKNPYASVASGTLVGTLAPGNSQKDFGSASSSEEGYFFSGTTFLKFPFTSDVNSAGVGSPIPVPSGSYGTIIAARRGFQSKTNGYVFGGQQAGGPDGGTPGNRLPDCRILKFPFASETASEIGGTLAQRGCFGLGYSALDAGFVIGGKASNNPAIPFPFDGTMIQRFSFASEAPAADVGELHPQTGAGRAASHDS